jgi:hypothetical protein
MTPRATMGGLWTNDRDTLAKQLGWLMKNGPLLDSRVMVDYLINHGDVRVLDPDDTELRGRLAKRLREIEVQAVAGIHKDDTWWAAGQLIEALRQP